MTDKEDVRKALLELPLAERLELADEIFDRLHPLPRVVVEPTRQEARMLKEGWEVNKADE